MTGRTCTDQHNTRSGPRNQMPDPLGWMGAEPAQFSSSSPSQGTGDGAGPSPAGLCVLQGGRLCCLKSGIPKPPSQSHHPKAGMSQCPDSLELPREAQGAGQIQLLGYPGPTRSSYSQIPHGCVRNPSLVAGRLLQKLLPQGGPTQPSCGDDGAWGHILPHTKHLPKTPAAQGSR